MATEDTRPAGIGIDLSGIDIDAAIFKATGGALGTPQGGDPDGSLLGPPVNPDIWVTNTGSPGLPDDPSDGFDPSLLGDPDATIRYTTDPVMPDNPLLDLMKQEETPHFANGGPEGQAIAPVVVFAVVAAVVIIGGAAYVAHEWSKESAQAPVVEPAAEGEGKDLNAESNKAMDAAKKQKATYLSDPDADGGPQMDGAVLHKLVTDLLGTSDLDALGSDPKAFAAAVSHFAEALVAGKVGEVADLLNGLEDFGLDVDALLAGGLGAKIDDMIGLDDMLGFNPLAMDMDAFAVELMPMVTEAILEAQQEQHFTLITHDAWW